METLIWELKKVALLDENHLGLGTTVQIPGLRQKQDIGLAKHGKIWLEKKFSKIIKLGQKKDMLKVNFEGINCRTFALKIKE